LLINPSRQLVKILVFIEEIFLKNYKKQVKGAALSSPKGWLGRVLRKFL